MGPIIASQLVIDCHTVRLCFYCISVFVSYLHNYTNLVLFVSNSYITFYYYLQCLMMLIIATCVILVLRHLILLSNSWEEGKREEEGKEEDSKRNIHIIFLLEF